ncbi:hypothetical protein OROMI_030549 [Orobanche minor]
MSLPRKLLSTKLKLNHLTKLPASSSRSVPISISRSVLSALSRLDLSCSSITYRPEIIILRSTSKLDQLSLPKLMIRDLFVPYNPKMISQTVKKPAGAIDCKRHSLRYSQESSMPEETIPDGTNHLRRLNRPILRQQTQAIDSKDDTLPEVTIDDLLDKINEEWSDVAFAGDHRDVAKCTKVPEFVKEAFVEHFAMKKRVKESIESIPHFDESVLEEQEQDEENEHGKWPIANPSNQVGSSQFNEAQKKLRFDAVRKFCRWMYDACIPFNALRYDSLRPAIEAIGVYGSGMKPPPYHEARVPILKEEIKHTKLLLKDNEEEKSGCSLMAEGWRDRNGSYSHAGQKMFELLDRFIQKVGPDDVVQVVTDSASNNVLAGRLLEDNHSIILLDNKRS